jgi:hypothetical protein
MDEKTARKYRKLGKLPSEVKADHTWRTRENPFVEVWAKVVPKLSVNPGLEAKTLFLDLQRRYPGRFQDGQLRTFQRLVKRWRATEGPSREIFFPQVHHPGELCESDFTHLDSLGITISGQPFSHMIYHFVLTYSNWETGTICFSESFESLSQGLQNALWSLGGVPRFHRTDQLSSAVKKAASKKEFTDRYSGLLRHYHLEGQKIQVRKPNENGDIEQRHYRFQRAIEQSLLLRGSRDFSSRAEYDGFLKQLFGQLNSGRSERLSEELPLLRELPLKRLDACKRLQLKVGPSSTIRVNHNVYSVNSRLINEQIEVRLYAEHLEIWYGQLCLEKIPRLRGESKHRINYRHVIDWLVRKPGAFTNYRYRSDLFPTHRFRMTYDYLQQHYPSRSNKEYLGILELSAKESETAVDEALNFLIDGSHPLTLAKVAAIVDSGGYSNQQRTLTFLMLTCHSMICFWIQLWKSHETIRHIIRIIGLFEGASFADSWGMLF